MAATSDGSVPFYPSSVAPRFLEEEITRVKNYLSTLQSAKNTYDDYRMVYGGGPIMALTPRPLLKVVQESRHAFIGNLPAVEMDGIGGPVNFELNTSHSNPSPEPVTDDVHEGAAALLALSAGFGGSGGSRLRFNNYKPTQTYVTPTPEPEMTTPVFEAGISQLSSAEPTAFATPAVTMNHSTGFRRASSSSTSSSSSIFGVFNHPFPKFNVGPPLFKLFDSDSDEETGKPTTFATPAVTAMNDNTGFRRDSNSSTSSSSSIFGVSNRPFPKVNLAPPLFKLFDSDSDNDMNNTIKEAPIKREELEVIQPEPMELDEPQPVAPTAHRRKTVRFADASTPEDDSPNTAHFADSPVLEDDSLHAPAPGSSKLPSMRIKKTTDLVKPTARRKQNKKPPRKVMSTCDKNFQELRKTYDEDGSVTELAPGAFFASFGKKIQRLKVRTSPRTQPASVNRRPLTRDEEDQKVRRDRDKTRSRGSRPWSERTGFDVKRIGQHELVDSIDFRCAICDVMNTHRTHECPDMRVQYDIVKLNQQGAEKAPVIHLIRPKKITNS